MTSAGKYIRTISASSDEIALISTVGRNMSSRPGISGRLFAALGSSGINIRMIAQGSDEINIIVGVENKDFEKTISVIYEGFVGKEETRVKRYSVAILGATGAVGREMMKVLEERQFAHRPAEAAGQQPQRRKDASCSMEENRSSRRQREDSFDGIDIVLGGG